MKNDLEALRLQMNDLNERLVELLNERATLALRIGKVKASMQKAIYDPGQERLVLEQVDRLNRGPLSKGALEEVFCRHHHRLPRN
ncbi:MAG: chorismate mutase [Candidatus Saccharibacteria bacterium]